MIQWRCSCDLDTLWQRFGRAARGQGRTGLAVLFTEEKHTDEFKAKEKERAEKRKAKNVTKLASQELGKRKLADAEPDDGGGRRKKRRVGKASRAVIVLEAEADEDVELSLFESLRVEYKKAMPKVHKGRAKQTSAKELGPEIEHLVNAGAEGRSGCYRAPIMAFYENDHTTGSFLLVSPCGFTCSHTALLARWEIR